MSKKPILLLLLLLSAPIAAWAECGFASTDEGVTIVVGKKSNKCFSSENFREAFKSQLVASVEAMDAEEAQRSGRQKKSIDQRSASAQKLWTLEERVYQSTSPSGRYFGQR